MRWDWLQGGRIRRTVFSLKTLILFNRDALWTGQDNAQGKRPTVRAGEGRAREHQPGTIPHVNMLIFDFTFARQEWRKLSLLGERGFIYALLTRNDVSVRRNKKFGACLFYYVAYNKLIFRIYSDKPLGAVRGSTAAGFISQRYHCRPQWANRV